MSVVVIGAESMVLLVEPVYEGSHMVFMDVVLDELQKYNIGYTFVYLRGRKWHRKARHAAIKIANAVPRVTSERYLFCSSALSLHDLLGLRRDLHPLKKVVYFHENQLEYAADHRSYNNYHLALNQLTTCIAADVIFFNSCYNRDTFIEKLEQRFSRTLRDRTVSMLHVITHNSAVLYFPMEYPRVFRRAISPRDCLRIVWPHRWEADKNPQLFLDTLIHLCREDIPFSVALLGLRVREIPDYFYHVKEELGDRVTHFGYVEDREEYLRILCSSHVVVSTALRDYFGVAVLEATFCGCMPLVPNAVSYTEMYPRRCLYEDSEDFYEKLKAYCRDITLISDWRTDNGQFGTEGPNYVNFRKYSKRMVLPRLLREITPLTLEQLLEPRAVPGDGANPENLQDQPPQILHNPGLAHEDHSKRHLLNVVDLICGMGDIVPEDLFGIIADPEAAHGVGPRPEPNNDSAEGPPDGTNNTTEGQPEGKVDTMEEERRAEMSVNPAEGDPSSDNSEADENMEPRPDEDQDTENGRPDPPIDVEESPEMSVIPAECDPNEDDDVQGRPEADQDTENGRSDPPIDMDESPEMSVIPAEDRQDINSGEAAEGSEFNIEAAKQRRDETEDPLDVDYGDLPPIASGMPRVDNEVPIDKAARRERKKKYANPGIPPPGIEEEEESAADESDEDAEDTEGEEDEESQPDDDQLEDLELEDIDTDDEDEVHFMFHIEDIEDMSDDEFEEENEEGSSEDEPQQQNKPDKGNP